MRILRWRLKLAEYDYEVEYKAGKMNVNADALSRNPINFEEVDCKPVRKGRQKRKISKDAKTILKTQREFDEEEDNYKLYLSDSSEEDDNYELRLSDTEENDDYKSHLSDSEEENYELHFSDTEENENAIKNNTDSIPFTQEELDEPNQQIIERALIHSPPTHDKILTRSLTARRRITDQDDLIKEQIDDNIILLDDRNDPSDKENSDEDEEQEDIDNNQEINIKNYSKPTINN
ncbi:protein IWS1 homolog [Linepithema humile]|uniref:protein IWS1 homolog n=1 Tax=Linepithema humile TaxID=83485 RepID=UPI00351E3847